jgi:class 3 adenylate cyclase
MVDAPGVETAVALADRAAPGQLLVSATVHDLVGGSGLPLEPAGDDAYRAALPTPAP